MPRSSTQEQERALQDKANKWMIELAKTYDFLKPGLLGKSHRKEDSKQDVAAMEALKEIRQKLSA